MRGSDDGKALAEENERAVNDSYRVDFRVSPSDPSKDSEVMSSADDWIRAVRGDDDDDDDEKRIEEVGPSLPPSITIIDHGDRHHDINDLGSQSSSPTGSIHCKFFKPHQPSDPKASPSLAQSSKLSTRRVKISMLVCLSLTSAWIQLSCFNLLILKKFEDTSSIFLLANHRDSKLRKFNATANFQALKTNTPTINETCNYETITNHFYGPGEEDLLRPVRDDELSLSALRPTSSHITFDDSQTEAWISSSRIHRSIVLDPKTFSRPSQIDLLWTWTNGTFRGPGQDSIFGSNDYLYREHDELRFSLRSSLDSFKKDRASELSPSKTDGEVTETGSDQNFIRSRQILASDEPISGRFEIPSWYNLEDQSKLSKSDPERVKIRFHSQSFKLHSDKVKSDKGKNSGQDDLKNQLPSHNSLAIESQIGHLNGIEDHLLYLNDDCFFLNEFNAADFVTEYFGSVFRIQFDLNVRDDFYDRSNSFESLGEWPSLGYSNLLLSKRFGSRERKYLLHLPKVLNFKILREVSEVWKDEISNVKPTTKKNLPSS